MKLPDTIKQFLLKIPGSQLGFTMIELLVVISVIGVLAVAVLSSINPIEQINKGRDTRTRSDAAQLINAVDRFFSIHEIYPWNDATYNDGLQSGDTAYSIAFPDDLSCTIEANGFCLVEGQDDDTDWLAALTETAEVKPGFVSRLRAMPSDSALQVVKGAGTNTNMYVCFVPSSEAFKSEAVSNCLAAQQGGGIGLPDGDIPDGACPAGDGGYSDTSDFNELDPEMICLP